MILRDQNRMKSVHWIGINKFIINFEQNQRRGGAYANGLRSKWGAEEIKIRRSTPLF